MVFWKHAAELSESSCISTRWLGVGSAGGDGSLSGEKKSDGLTQKVGRIRSALAIDVSASLPEAIKQANKAMGLDDRGSLPEQATRLVEALGLQ